jgi:hypothetical protein
MSLFDLLFIAVFLGTVVTLLSAAFLTIRGRGSRALALLVRCLICVGVYLGIVVLASVFWPQTVLQVGERRCFDDWCLAVENASRQEARGVTQRENAVVVYLADERGRRYDPIPDPSAVPLNIQLGPQESVAATRSFELPPDAREPGLVIAHEGGFPIGWFIIGDETWFHKPTIVRLH